MSDSGPNEKHGSATIWFLAILVVGVVGAAMQDKPIVIAATDNPPSISTPVTGLDANRTSMQRTRSGSLPPPAPAGTQIFYGGWSVPQ
jgi:hypothetical protein